MVSSLSEQKITTPSPTVATTDQLRREITALRDLREIAQDGLRSTIETRLNAMDKAIELLQQSTNRIPDHIIKAIATLQELHDEKFHSISIQFLERDTRTEQAAKDSKVAIDAALQAQKESVGEQNKLNALAISKSEAAFTKQIDQIVVLLSAMGKAIDDKIGDIKDRIGKIETSSIGRITTIEGRSQGHNDFWGWAVGGIGALVAIASLFLLLPDKLAR